MDTSRIAALLAPFLARRAEIGVPDEPAVLSAHQLRDISIYIDILQRWNARVNLTAIRDLEEIVTRHFGESLFAARHLFPGIIADEIAAGTSKDGETHAAAKRRNDAAHGASRGSGAAQVQAAEQRKKITVADVGSGPGFPGLPIKLWAPDISLTLIESNHKKATFLREVARALTLTDVNIQNARAESLAGSSFNVVTLRAVERFETILPIAGRLLAPQGRLALLVGSAQADQALSATSHLSWFSPLPIPGSHSRVLLIANNA